MLITDTLLTPLHIVIKSNYSAVTAFSGSWLIPVWAASRVESKSLIFDLYFCTEPICSCEIFYWFAQLHTYTSKCPTVIMSYLPITGCYETLILVVNVKQVEHKLTATTRKKSTQALHYICMCGWVCLLNMISGAVYMYACSSYIYIGVATM